MHYVGCDGAFGFHNLCQFGEKIDENRWVFFDAGCDNCFPSWVGTTQILWGWFGLFLDSNLLDYGLEVLLFEKEINMFTLMINFWNFSLGSCLRLNS